MSLSSFELHVYPEMCPQLFDPNNSARGETGERHYVAGMPTRGIRAHMLYIHGSKKDWGEPSRADWLAKEAHSRLVDDNPARVVYLNA